MYALSSNTENFCSGLLQSQTAATFLYTRLHGTNNRWMEILALITDVLIDIKKGEPLGIHILR